MIKVFYTYFDDPLPEGGFFSDAIEVETPREAWGIVARNLRRDEPVGVYTDLRSGRPRAWEITLRGEKFQRFTDCGAFWREWKKLRALGRENKQNIKDIGFDFRII